MIERNTARTAADAQKSYEAVRAKFLAHETVESYRAALDIEQGAGTLVVAEDENDIFMIGGLTGRGMCTPEVGYELLELVGFDA